VARLGFSTFLEWQRWSSVAYTFALTLPIPNDRAFRAHNFPRKNLTNSAANLVNSAVNRGKADEIPRLIAEKTNSAAGPNPNTADPNSAVRGQRWAL